MKTVAKSYFFDGKTSKPHLIDLEVFSQNYIVFYHENKRYIWKFQDIIFDKSSSKLTLSNQSNPSEFIKIDNPEISNKIYRFAKQSKNLTWYQSIIDLGAKSYVIAFFSIIMIIAASYFFLIPKLGEKAAEIMPDSFGDKLGSISYNNIKTTLKIDENKSNKLQNFANRLNFGTKKKLVFKVINDDDVNAFALPNGMVFVNSGLLAKIKNYEELVALLGHEVAHIKEKHSVKTLTRNLAGYLLVSVIIGDANGIMTIVAENANQLNNLSFSRSFERESDYESYEIMKRNKINPKGLHDLFVILKSTQANETLALLSTHPLTSDRIEFSKLMMDKKDYTYIKHKELEQIFLELKK